MMDLGFMPQIRDLLARLPRQRQTLLFSATMPREIRGLADQFLNQPQEISVAPIAKPIETVGRENWHLSRAHALTLEARNDLTERICGALLCRWNLAGIIAWDHPNPP